MSSRALSLLTDIIPTLDVKCKIPNTAETPQENLSLGAFLCLMQMNGHNGHR